MMGRRRRSPLRYVFPAAIVFASLYLTHTWPFSRSVPSGNMMTMADGASQAYDGLSAQFRARVPLTEFSDMFRPMSQRGMPQFKEARVTSPIGEEAPAAHFDVDYPASNERFEYDFARVEGKWDLYALRIVRGPWVPKKPVEEERERDTVADTDSDQGALPGALVKAPAPHVEERTPTVFGKSAPSIAKLPEAPAELPKATTDRRFPCTYRIQAGDNLSGISRHFYGTIKYWRQILEANPGISEKRLRIGRTIRIPVPPQPLSPQPAIADKTAAR